MLPVVESLKMTDIGVAIRIIDIIGVGVTILKVTLIVASSRHDDFLNGRYVVCSKIRRLRLSKDTVILTFYV